MPKKKVDTIHEAETVESARYIKTEKREIGWSVVFTYALLLVLFLLGLLFFALGLI